jgi:hypothetical protein
MTHPQHDDDDASLVVRTYPKSSDIVSLGCTLQTANRLRRTAGCPYIWYDKSDDLYLIQAVNLGHAMKIAQRIGVTVTDRRDSGRDSWCGECDERTRTTDSRFGVIRCPRCHPDPGKPTSTIPREEVDAYHEGVQILRAQLQQIRTARAAKTTRPELDDDDGLPF